MNRNDIADRKRRVMIHAAERFRAKAPAVSEAATKLAQGGPSLASSPELVRTFLAREQRKHLVRARIGAAPPASMLPGGVGPFFERKIGDGLDWVLIPPTQEARTAGHPVARLVELPGGRRVGDGFATGFLIGPGLLMTNWHVFATAADVALCGAHFDYEEDDTGLARAGVVFELDPNSFFYSDEQHDIAIVGVSDRCVVGVGGIGAFGSTTLIPSRGKLLVGHSINIIQHPDGGLKHWAMQQNRLYVEPKDDDLFLTYTTNTLEGSSGSPAFNNDWELVAVHHGGVPRVEDGDIRTLSGGIWKKGMPDTDIQWVANEGARISKVYELLRGVRMPDATQQARLTRLLGSAAEMNRPETLPRAPDTTTPDDSEEDGAMRVTVNGPATFYLGSPPAQSTSVAAPLVVMPQVPIVPEKKLRYDPDYKHRPGYQSKFLAGYDVPLPTAPKSETLNEGASAIVLKYHHYSLVMHEERRLVMWAASNVDYNEGKRTKKREDFGTDSWKADPRIAIEHQIEDTECYDPAKKFDRGHVVRRDDVAWGDTAEEEVFANSDSFHWTNCTPQHEQFNRDVFGYHGLWGEVENHIAEQAQFVGKRLTIFAGPILAADDPVRDFGGGPVKVPAAFWKVVIVAESQGNQKQLRAYGFVLDQMEAIKQYGWEGRFSAGKFSEKQESLATITSRTRVEFAQKLHDGDPLAGDPTESKGGRRLETLEGMKLA